MRHTRMLCRLALAGGATLLTVTACSGGSHTGSASSTTSVTASTSAASSSAAPARDAAFCDQAQTFVDQVQAAVVAQAQGQADLAEKLPPLISRLQSVSPPPAIAADWHTALSALQQLARTFQGVNLSDPQQLQQLEQKVAPIEMQLGAVGQHIETYLTTQCGITIGSTPSPTG